MTRGAPELILEISVLDASLQLFVAGQGHFDVSASAPDHFFLDAVEAQFSFVRDSSGAAVSMTYTQNGVTSSAPRLF